MKIGVVGNRKNWTYEQVRAKLLELKVSKLDIIISGGAEGVDSHAQQFAKEIGAQLRVIYPDPDLPSPKRYYDRNEKIAYMCDKLIAFNSEGPRSGTHNTITHATNLSKEVIVVDK